MLSHSTYPEHFIPYTPYPGPSLSMDGPPVHQHNLTAHPEEHVSEPLHTFLLSTPTQGRKLPGTLEAHANGFRYSNPKNEVVNVMYRNIKV